MRMGASTCFLDQARQDRLNLHVLTKSTVKKITLEGKKVTGVVYTQNGITKSMKCKREVILCAGAVGSAKLLLLSGIGLQKELNRHKINVVHELPVGEGLQDHVIFLGMVVTTTTDLIGLSHMNQSVAQYMYNRTAFVMFVTR
ncbi:oxygen-dependent choline dehydrogenase-like [Dermacentor silvarum]|uniref:oxygen-dependent choline dehydrogenase-like n=1 Tax=Dermacentor silvarum TaxID=543639 RepID=UPI002100F7A6|nr:oxygen-dependent choline dehydrogenase-like [Dermacentor silvarum]